MDEQVQLMSEYQRLRDEILQADSRNYQVLGFLVAACGATLGGSLSVTNSSDFRYFAALLVYCLTFPAYRVLCGNRRRTWRLSTYMRVFLEPKLSATKWETRLADLGKQEGKASNLFSSKGHQAEWTVITILNLAAGSIFCFQVQRYHADYFLLSVVLLFLLNLALAFSTLSDEKSLRRHGEFEINLLENWRALQHEEVAKGRDQAGQQASATLPA